MKISSKKVFYWKKNLMAFFKNRKFSKTSLFSKKLVFKKVCFLKKVTFWKNSNFFLMSSDFIFKKTKLFRRNFHFSLFIISHPQAVQFWASNSSTSTFGQSLCARHFFKNRKIMKNRQKCPQNIKSFLDLVRLKKTNAI